MNKILTLIVVIFSVQVAFASDPTPPPPTPPPPPGLPIDGNVLLFLSIAFIIGYYLSMKYKLVKKGS